MVLKASETQNKTILLIYVLLLHFNNQLESTCSYKLPPCDSKLNPRKTLNKMLTEITSYLVLRINFNNKNSRNKALSVAYGSAISPRV